MLWNDAVINDDFTTRIDSVRVGDTERSVSREGHTRAKQDRYALDGQRSFIREGRTRAKQDRYTFDTQRSFSREG